jgi:hypothetical protein
MTGDIQSLTVRNRAQAKQLEEKLRQGMGLSAKDFQPITLMWNVAEEIQTIEDYEEANEVIRDTYQRNKRAFQEAKKEGRDVSIQVSGSARFSVAKAAASLGVKMHSAHRTNVDELDDKVEKGYLSNNDDLKKYKSKLRKLKGQEIKIVGRGIDLIESSQLKQKLNLMASYVFVQPMREAKTFTTSSKISSSAKKGRGDILINKVAEMDRRLMKLENSLVPNAQKTADKAQATADDAVNLANRAQGTADHAVNLANRAQGTANTALSKLHWEDITSDKGHFNVNCQYKWTFNRGYGQTTAYATAIRHDVIWTEYSDGAEYVFHHNKAVTDAHNGAVPAHTYRRCQ